MVLRNGIPPWTRWAALAILVLFAAGCRQHPLQTQKHSSPSATQAAQAAPSAPVSNAVPNELGRVLVLEYHQIGEHEERWTRTPENFRKDLETLYRHGFRAVSLRDYVAGAINLPRGARPVVFTFDDSTEGQFRYLEKGGKPVVDPRCAVGMLEAFHQAHPDFGLKASFYVLPWAFGQPRYVKQKLQYLAANGMEIGNHTYDHLALRKLSNTRVQEELARAQQNVQEALPNYRFFSLALPLGIAPREKALARQGEWSGIRYQHRAVLLVGSTPAPAPWAISFDPYSIPRVQATDMVEPAYQLSAQLQRLVTAKNRGYVSDGDPRTVSVPAALRDEVDVARLGGKQLKVIPAAR